MEQNLSKNETNIKITKRDKIYLSIIAVLIVAIVVLAIVLPRPYKIVEVDKPIDNYIYQKVYDTKKVYIISEDSLLYDENYVDTDGQEYTILEKFSLIDTGALKNATATVVIDIGGTESTYKLKLSESLIKEFVKNVGDGVLGTDIIISSSSMKSLDSVIRECISDLSYSQSYLLSFEFEDVIANYIVTYVK